jgi:hypothetical protein
MHDLDTTTPDNDGGAGTGPDALSDTTPEATDMDNKTPPAVDAGTDACASATWISRFDGGGGVPVALALDSSGRLYAGGGTGSSAWIAEINTCDGGVLRQNTFGGDQVNTLAVGTDLFAGGNKGLSNAFIAHLDQTLTPTTTTILPGSGLSGLPHVTIDSDGTLWLAGGQNAFQSTATGWIVHEAAALTTTTCQVTGGATGIGMSGVVAGANGGVEAIVNTNAGGVVLTMDAACTVLGQSAAVQPAMNMNTFVQDLTGVGGTLYTAGFARASSSSSSVGFVASLKSGGAAWTVSALQHPTMQLDMIDHIASDGDALYAAGLNGQVQLNQGTPALYKFSLPLNANANSVWAPVDPFPNLGIAPGDLKVAPQGEDGVYVAGAIDGDISKGGAIVRCQKGGTCPH